jgi:hypothetical protein
MLSQFESSNATAVPPAALLTGLVTANSGAYVYYHCVCLQNVCSPCVVRPCGVAAWRVAVVQCIKPQFGWHLRIQSYMLGLAASQLCDNINCFPCHYVCRTSTGAWSVAVPTVLEAPPQILLQAQVYHSRSAQRVHRCKLVSSVQLRLYTYWQYC